MRYGLRYVSYCPRLIWQQEMVEKYKASKAELDELAAAMDNV